MRPYGLGVLALLCFGGMANADDGTAMSSEPTTELSQASLSELVNDIGAGGGKRVDQRPLNAIVVTHPMCAGALNARHSEIGTLLSSAFDIESAWSTMRGHRGLYILVLIDGDMSSEPLVEVAAKDGHDLIAYNFAKPCDVPAIIETVKRVDKGRKDGMRAPIFAHEPFSIQQLEVLTGALSQGLPRRRVFAKGVSAREDSSITKATWLFHLYEAKPAAQAGPFHFTRSHVVGIGAILAAVGVVIAMWIRSSERGR